jgi:tetratricopeptide (TPR) repeat protein
MATAKLYIAQSRNTEAEILLEQAIPVLERASDTEDATLAAALNDLAAAYTWDGRYAKAEPLYARVLFILEKHPEAMSEDIRTGFQGYVQMLRKMKRKSDSHHLESLLKTMPPK